MTVSPPSLYWYQLDVGTYVPNYLGQLDTSVAQLCAANSVPAPTSPYYNPITGGYVSAWLSQTDTAVRALCVVLSVDPPTALTSSLTSGTIEPVYAQSLDTCVRALCAAAPPPSYTGPLDLTATPAVVAYGQRAMSAAKLGSAVYTIRRSSDDTTQSFSSDATTGAVVAAAISAFIGGGAGFVSTWNDQSGNASNALQATAGKQPAWSSSASGGKPGLSFDSGNSQTLITGGNVPLTSGAYTTFYVIKAVGPITRHGVWGENGNAAITFDYVVNFFTTATSLDIDQYDNTNEAGGQFTVPDITVAPGVLDAAWQFGSHSVNWNGTAATQTGDFDTGGPVGSVSYPLAVGCFDAVDQSTSLFNGLIVELLIFEAILSDADRLAIRQNIAAYYGITLS